VLTVKTAAHEEEFLRLSQRELHLALSALKEEHLSTTRSLAEIAKSKQFKVLCGLINHVDSRLKPGPWEKSVGMSFRGLGRLPL
jgi:hypothetical protein